MSSIRSVVTVNSVVIPTACQEIRLLSRHYANGKHEVIINLIANTTTQSGLRVRAELDVGRYVTGITVSDQELAAVNLHRADFHGDWNYTILPLQKKK